MLLKSFKVEGLFDTFNYNLDFENKSNLLVLTGLNGYGKTTILRILSSLSDKDELFYLYEIPFNKIKVDFDNGTALVVTKATPKVEIIGDEVTDELQTTKLSYQRGRKVIAKFVIDQDSYLASDYYERNHKSSKDKDTDGLRSLRWISYKFDGNDEQLEKLAMSLSVFNTCFIRSQRLYNETKDGKSQRAINEVARNMSKILSMAHYNYLSNAQDLDGHQIDELLADNTPLLSEDDYDRKSAILDMLASELLSYNLLPQLHIRPYNPAKALISSVYINTLEKKLNVYEDVCKKLRLFLYLLNNKKFVNKKFAFSRNEGLRVLLKTGGVLNDLTKLSSGEQNEIFLLFKLIFEVPNKSVLLIDEPELSLHVAWQLQFIKDIKEIAKAREIQIVIATHSPEIVSESMDYCIDLTEMSNAQ